MELVLRNMANMLLLDFVRRNGIDTGIAGTYCKKDGRGFTYSLRDAETGQKSFATVTFHKSSVPTFSCPIHNA